MGERGEVLGRSMALFIGAGGAAALLALFFGVTSWVNSPAYAWGQFVGLWPWLLMLAAGFGLQLGLYSYVRAHARQELKGAAAEVAASGGVSAGSMLACCAHYVAAALPFMGLSALAVFLAEYQKSFLVLGVFSNLVGLTFMLYLVQQHGLLPRLVGAEAASRCNMRRVRNAAIVMSAIAVSLSFLFAALG